MIARIKTMTLAGLLLLGGCSVPQVPDYQAHRVGHRQKAVFGRIEIREKNGNDVTDRCHVWIRRSDFGLKLTSSHDFAQVVDADEDGMYELTCALERGTVKYRFRHLRYRKTDAETKTYIGDIRIALYPTEDDLIERYDKTAAGLRALWPFVGDIYERHQDQHFGAIAIDVADESERAFAGYAKRYGRDNLTPVTALLQARGAQ